MRMAPRFVLVAAVVLAGPCVVALEAQEAPASRTLPTPFRAVPPPVDGEVAFSEQRSVPLMAVDWEESTARTEAWLRTEWSRRGLHVAVALPHAARDVRMPAGRAPATPFRVILEIEGAAGPYTVSCVPLVDPVSPMTRRLHAYLFNHRLGVNVGMGETGHVLCHEISLLGIITDSMETRWSERPGGGLAFEAVIPWETLRLPVPAAATELAFAIHVEQPEREAVHWEGGVLRLAGGAEPGPELRPDPVLPGPSVLQPDTIAAAYAVSAVPASAAVTFELRDAAGETRARVRASRSGDALFGRLPTAGLADGEYAVHVLAGGRSVAARGLRLVGQRASTTVDAARERLTDRLERLDGRSLTAAQEGHAARARRIVALAALPPYPDSAAVAGAEQLVADAEAVVDALEAGRRPDRAHEGFEHPAGFALDGRRGPVTFVPRSGDAARLTVRAADAVDWRLTERLYGTFSEPVVYDRPIYSFLYAQQLRNPSFEFGHPTPEQTLEAFVRYGELERSRAEAAMAGRWLPRQPAGVEEVAAPWIGVGSGTVTFDVDCAAYNDRQCQRVRAGADARDAGVAQVIELPAWRTTGYDLRGFLRSDGSVRTARAVLYHDGRPVDSVSLDGIGTEWQEFTAVLGSPRVEGPRNTFLLAIVFDGPGILDIDFVTLYPDDAVDGFDPQAVAQLGGLHTGWVRWPGGNYASDYRWRDGVGPRDLRPSTANPSWPGLNPNLVGTDEFLQLGERLGFEVMVTVNAGSGTAEEAAQWVEYVNGDTTTTLGRLRARNGHPEPYGVRYWNIGNELWGHWQVGYTNPGEYARRYAAFVQAMRAVDPTITIIANAHGGHSESPPEPWNRPLLEHYGDQLEIMDIHTYVGVPSDAGYSPAEQAFLLSGIPLSYEQWIAELRQDLLRRELPDVDVIVGEYNASINSGSRAMDRVADMLAYAGYLHAFMRQGEYVVGANATEYSVFNPRAGPFGLLHPRYDIFRTYAEQAGSHPLEATLETPVRQQPFKVGRDVLPMFNLPLVDAVVLRDPEDGSLGISLLNRNMADAVTVEVELQGFQPDGEGRRYVFAGDSEGMMEEPVEVGPSFEVTLPAHSLSLYKVYPAEARLP